MSSVPAILRASSLLLTGAAVGIGVAALVLTLGEAALETGLLVGAVAGLGAFCLFLLIRTLLVTLALRQLGGEAAPDGPVARAALTYVTRIGALVGQPADEAEAQGKAVIEATAGRLRGWISAALALWGASASLALAVTMAGLLISVGTLVLSQRQITRLDRQNSLIEQQIYEAKATRISTVFAAQLPALLAAIEAERGQQGADWVPSRALTSQIQAMVNLAEPYATDLVVDGWLARLRAHFAATGGTAALEGSNFALYGGGNLTDALARPRLFSPERGQLLVLLIGLGFPFQALETPLDFAAADLRNLRLGPGGLSPLPLIDLDMTGLRFANLRGADPYGIDLSKADLTGAALPLMPPGQMPRYVGPLRGTTGSDARAYRQLAGAELSFAMVEIGIGGFQVMVEEAGFPVLGPLPGGGDVAQLWSMMDFDDVALILPAPATDSAVRALETAMAAVGGLEVSPAACAALSDNLEDVRRLIGDHPGPLSNFVQTRLAEFDPSLLACVSGQPSR